MSLIVAGGALSVLAAARATTPPSHELMVGLPLLALLVVLVVRAAAGPTGRVGDLVVVLLVAFLVGLHVLLLAAHLRLTDRPEALVPLGTALLFVLLGPVVAGLEHGSAMGLRTRATLAGEVTWRRAHRTLGLAFSAAGVAGVGPVLWGAPTLAVVTLGALPVLAMVGVSVRAAREERGPPSRPSSERDQGLG
jgi:uncharacterized membrane protein